MDDLYRMVEAAVNDPDTVWHGNEHVVDATVRIIAIIDHDIGVGAFYLEGLAECLGDKLKAEERQG